MLRHGLFSIKATNRTFVPCYYLRDMVSLASYPVPPVLRHSSISIWTVSPHLPRASDYATSLNYHPLCATEQATSLTRAYARCSTLLSIDVYVVRRFCRTILSNGHFRSSTLLSRHFCRNPRHFCRIVLVWLFCNAISGRGAFTTPAFYFVWRFRHIALNAPQGLFFGFSSVVASWGQP